MKQENEQQRATEVDPQVSDQYEALANEKTPAHLDRAILREAARAVRADNRKGSFGAWFRPVAFMAMVGLSLAIILDLSDTSIFRPVADLSIEATPTVQAPPKSVADSIDRNTSQPALNEIKRQEKLAPAQAQADARDDEIDDADIATPQAAASEPRKGDQGQLRKMRSEVVAAITLPPAEAPACSKEQKSDVEEWWKCIAALRQAGLTELADLEFENLRSSFPDFEPPE
jgi:hypothetical protein